MCGKNYILPRIDKQNSRIASEAKRWERFVSTVNVVALPTANYYYCVLQIIKLQRL
jgi:hypothetical protein